MHLQKRLTARLKIYLVNCLILPFAAALWQPFVLLLKLFIANHRNKIPQITPIRFTFSVSNEITQIY